MTLIKKKDVKAYFSERQRKGVHLVSDVAESRAIVKPGAGSPIETNTPAFADDVSLEHSSSGGAVSAVVMVTSFAESHAPELPATPEV